MHFQKESLTPTRIFLETKTNYEGSGEMEDVFPNALIVGVIVKVDNDE